MNEFICSLKNQYECSVRDENGICTLNKVSSYATCNYKILAVEPTSSFPSYTSYTIRDCNNSGFVPDITKI